MCPALQMAKGQGRLAGTSRPGLGVLCHENLLPRTLRVHRTGRRGSAAGQGSEAEVKQGHKQRAVKTLRVSNKVKALRVCEER